MTILPLYHTKEPDKKVAPEIPTQIGDRNTVVTSDAQILIPKYTKSKKKKGCCHAICHGPNRSMWITVGFLSFAFMTLMIIQNVVGYLAYHGIGVRNDYGIVLNGGSMAEGVAFSWPHIPWKCAPGNLAPIREQNGEPVVFKHSPHSIYEGTGQDSVMDKLRPLLTHAAFHIPMKSHKDSTVYIVGGIAAEVDTLSPEKSELTEIIKREFNFEVEFVERFNAELGSFIDNAESHILSLINVQCQRLAPKADEQVNIDPGLIGHHE